MIILENVTRHIFDLLGGILLLVSINIDANSLTCILSIWLGVFFSWKYTFSTSIVVISIVSSAEQAHNDGYVADSYIAM